MIRPNFRWKRFLTRVGSLFGMTVMGALLHFSDRQVFMIGELMDVAQDLVTDYFGISSDEWRNYRYEVRTLAHLSQAEITDEALAQICMYECLKERSVTPTSSFDLYRICLQDNRILNAVKMSLNKIQLRPLLLYIFTHELSHIVRFSKYFKDFFASPEEKEEEEAIVHSITYEMLTSVSDRSLDCVLNRYRNCRWNLCRV